MAMARPQSSREAADALRTAVDRTVQATVGQASASRERAQDLVEEVSQVAGKLRDTLDDLRVASREDVREVEQRLADIEKRLAALEKPATKAASKSAAKKPKAAPRKSGK